MPVGIQDIEKLRTENCVYVDQTQFVYDLTRISRPYFLGRPRRFGKSLFISTLKAYFLGKKELFEGLAIAELEKDWIAYPVIYIDFNRGNNENLETVKILLTVMLDDYESEWGITEKYNDLSARFSTLIKVAFEKSGRKVVVLIDEYDKALINTMENTILNDELRNFFKGFYGVLKGMDYCLRFVFLTGVTKFSKVSIFSDLNQLKDISLDKRYAGICGISETELSQYFQPELAALAEEQEMTIEAAFAEMKKRYDGYHFALKGEGMYNPFSVINVLDSLEFKYYWFETGTPTFLVKALKNSKYDIRKLENDEDIDIKEINNYRIGETSLTPLLYQSGYLTIKSYDTKYNKYILGYPNEEVKYGFLYELIPAYTPQVIRDSTFSASRFCEKLDNGDAEGFMKQLTAFFASIPYDAIKKEHRDEQYYQHVFYLLFTLMGQYTKTEVKSAEGRADAVVKTDDSIYVFEFKMHDKATAEDALKQIDDNGYLIPYIADGRRLLKIGVEFSLEKKGIGRWLIIPANRHASEA
jgi:hypothetical protein